MELEFLTKKYPEFIYKNFHWKLNNCDLIVEFNFSMGDIQFHPFIIIHNVDQLCLQRLDKDLIDNLIFNLGLAEIPSYWKAACSPKIVVEAGYLDKMQISFWRNLFANMGQFFYQNNLPFIIPDFLITKAPKNRWEVSDKELTSRFLVPLGGGKDSLVTLELLKKYLLENPVARDCRGEKIITFTLNTNPTLQKVIKISGTQNIYVERKIDPQLLELNKKGYFNGHTPFSAILAVLSVVLAAIFDCQQVAISQERSSNEGNMVYRGKK